MPSHSPSPALSPKNLTKSDHRHILPSGVEPIDEDHYFKRNLEFARWLREEKDKYFDELKSDKARSYFRKFVKAWNKGKLPDHIYHLIDPTSVSSNQITSYKWSFVDNNSALENEQRKKVREAVGYDTYKLSPATALGSEAHKPRRVLGPSLPSSSELQFNREQAEGIAAAERLVKRKREKMDDRERLEDTLGPREVGKERMLEAKRAKRESDNAYRERKEDGGFEVSDDVLMGSGNSFKESIARRDAARARFETKRKEEREARTREQAERTERMRERDKKTMDMFQKMAKERYG